MSVNVDLVAEVRRLLDREAPVDPVSAAAQFDALVGRYGRARLAAALAVAAPADLAALLDGR